MSDSQSRESGFESPLCYRFEDWAFLYSPRCPSSLSFINKWVPGYRRWWKCVWIVFAHICCVARMLPLRSWVGVWMNRSDRGLWVGALSDPTDWILCYIKTYIYLFLSDLSERMVAPECRDVCTGVLFTVPTALLSPAPTLVRLRSTTAQRSGKTTPHRVHPTAPPRLVKPTLRWALPVVQPTTYRAEFPVLPFQRLGIFILSTMPQFNQLYKWVPGYRQWWKYEWLVFAARNCCMASMLPSEAELVSVWTSLPGVKV